MKRFVVCLLAAVLVLSLCSCSPKAMIQDKTRELLGLNPSESSSGGSNSSNSSGGGLGALFSAITDKESADKPAAPQATTPPPEDADYFGLMQWEWENAPEEGYVWTINAEGDETLDIMGLAQANYTFKLSCSHVGPDRFGVYRGTMEVSYNANMDILGQLLTATGGSMEYDGDGWFKNDNFLMRLEPYVKEDDENWVAAYGSLPKDEDPMVQAIMDQLLGGLLADMGPTEQEFEKSSDPIGHWFDWDVHLTEGDLSGFMALTGIAYGTTSASSYVDSSGTQVEAEGEAYIPLGGYFHERYSEEIENPMPYTVEMYEENQVVISFYSADGSPIVLKFYGTVDQIPVEETILTK